jgi:iron(II)-dependent oxidoreductase
VLFPLVAFAQQGWRFAENPLIPIAGGTFIFGSDNSLPNEKPEQHLTLRSFRLNKFEITNREFRAYVQASGARASFFDQHPVLGLDAHPVVGVSWDDANGFCRYFGLRLPTEQEWERAARGTGGKLYAWGNQAPTPDRANRGGAHCCMPDDKDGYPATAPVGAFPKGNNPEGISDLTGNVWEWVDGWYNPYGTQPAEERHEFRVLRGGAWNSDDQKLRATYRLAYRGDFRFAANGGFRCAAD